MNWMVIKRVLTSGGKNFARGGAVSAATVLIMTVTLAIIALLIFLSGLLTYTLDIIKDKVDVTQYFVTTASEVDILAIKERLEKLPQVESVTYTSREEALAAILKRKADDQLTLQAIDEVGGNPFDASLTIHAKDTSQYESIINFLDATPALSAEGTSIFDFNNYEQNKNVKETIDRLTLWIQAIREIGLAIIILFAIASILIAFATVRLAIYTAKDEIAVMRLVGASNAYIQGPFIVTGVITGVISAFLVLFLLWPATWYVGTKTADWFDGFNIASYYTSHFTSVFFILVASGIVLGAIASVFAINKYLKV